MNKRNKLIRKKYLFLFVMVMCNTNISLAQISDVGNWFIYYGNQKINKKLNWQNEVQYRNFNFIGDANQLLFRTGVGYNLSENNNNILLGYAYIKSFIKTNTGNKNVVNEHRIFQQFISKQNFNSFYVQHRYRIEERFFKDDFKIRFRYFLSLNKPLNKKTMEANAVYLSAYNEIFLNSKKTVFDRDRLYGGVGYCINKNLRLEVGYMSQIFESNSQQQFQIIFFNNIPFSKN